MARCVLESNNQAKTTSIWGTSLRCIGKIVEREKIFDEFGKYMDAHLSQVYQILESRTMEHFDDDLLSFLEMVARNYPQSAGAPEYLLRFISDLETVVYDLGNNYEELFALLNTILFKFSKVLLEDQNEGKQLINDLIRLVNTMLTQTWHYMEDNTDVNMSMVDASLLASQLIIQYFPSFFSSAEAIGQLLSKVQRLSESFDNLSKDSFIWGRLYGVFLSGFIYSWEATQEYCKSEAPLATVVGYISGKALTFETNYDRKVLINGLLAVFKHKMLAKEDDSTALMCLDTSIQQLHVQRMEEDKKQTNVVKNKKGAKNSSKAQISESERQDISAYNMIKGKQYNVDKLISDTDEEGLDFNEDNQQDEILYTMMGAGSQLSRLLRTLKSPLRKEDEFVSLQTIFEDLKTNHNQETLRGQLIDKLSACSRLVLPGILQVKRITEGSCQEEVDQPQGDALPRKIVKLKTRRKNNQQNSQPVAENVESPMINNI